MKNRKETTTKKHISGGFFHVLVFWVGYFCFGYLDPTLTITVFCLYWLENYLPQKEGNKKTFYQML